MLNIQLKTPIHANLGELTPAQIEKVKKFLSYTNKTAVHGISRLKRNRWLLRDDPEEWQKQMNELEANKKKNLFKDNCWTYSGLVDDIGRILKTDINITKDFEYPEFKMIPWLKPLEFDLRLEQLSSIKKLLQVKHGGIEMATGVGKSAIIMTLCKLMGIKAIVVTPSTSIFKGLLKDFNYHIGKKYVGAYGDGKKQIDKLITICVSKSLTTLVPGSKEYKFFNDAKVVLCDESHTLPANTLETVCHGVLANAPYRFFFSATQTRNDGAEKLLRGIIGPIVESLTANEAIKKRYLAKPRFKVVGVKSTNPKFFSSDAISMKRQHYLKNENIAKLAADIANRSYRLLGHQSLILVDDLDQIRRIGQYLKVPFDYAHGTKTKKLLEKIGLLKTDVQEKVDDFNDGKIPVLIGTSAVQMGTNFKPVNNLIMCQGGTSPIAIPQGLGRGTRLSDKKDIDPTDGRQFFNVWDFDVMGIDKMEKQLEKRLAMYEEIWPDIIKVMGWING